MNLRTGGRLLLAVLLTLTSVFASVSVASACGVGNYYDCGEIQGNGVRVGMTRADVQAASQAPIDAKKHPRGVAYEWASIYNCPFNKPGGTDVPCVGSMKACLGNPPALGQGPEISVYRRVLDTGGKAVGGWENLGISCLPDLVPGRPTLSIAAIQAQFHKTVFAKPIVHIQPEGNLTLVTLATYFEVTWPTAGFQPQEVDTTTLLGYQVRIRPTLGHYVYVFGDGTSLGPSASPGGTYPSGDVTHAYPKAGVYPTRIDITYGGEFSVNGAAWITIPDTATVTGTVQDLSVKTAHARLVNR